jgi:hypothetical protein
MTKNEFDYDRDYPKTPAEFMEMALGALEICGEAEAADWLIEGLASIGIKAAIDPGALKEPLGLCRSCRAKLIPFSRP